MRLDWFLPTPRKADPQERGSPGARKPGGLRRVLRRLGPTWAASPVRRAVQAAMFAGFLVLLFYVCWPYSARPAHTWGPWLPVEVDAGTGSVTVVSEQTPSEPVVPGQLLYVSEAGGQPPAVLGRFRVDRAGQKELGLVAAEPLDAEQLDALSASLGPWSLSEAEPGRPPSHYAESLRAKEVVAAEAFLAVDPLVSISTALAARCWVWSLVCAGAVLLICVVIPRGFCAYACPLGTLIDLFDRVLGRRVSRFHVSGRGWWARAKYYLLLGVLVASLAGVLVSGFVAAIPLLTRGLVFLVSPLQLGLARGWHQVPGVHAGQVVSIVLLAAILGLGFLGPRFWCKYVCPSGAVFSAVNLVRLSQRKVEASCTGCGRCVAICPFDAIESDFATRTADCTFCQTCGGVCPTRSIKFVGRWNREDLKPAGDPPPGGLAPGRRRFLGTAAGIALAAAAGTGAAAAIRAMGARPDDPEVPPLVRPPGSVPEEQFLQLCIRCGECFQACPNNVLQPQGPARGLEGLWIPRVVADWSGCEPSCNNCGQVCPTGAIRALRLEEKRTARMGLAVVDRKTCLPYAQRGACQLCVDECAAAGYRAIEFTKVGTTMDPFGEPIESSGFLVPVVLSEKCVGCGLCQTRCFAINRKAKGLLEESAIQVVAGEGKEDRLMSGPDLALREQRQRKREEERRNLLKQSEGTGGYLPDFLK